MPDSYDRGLGKEMKDEIYLLTWKLVCLFDGQLEL